MKLKIQVTPNYEDALGFKTIRDATPLKHIDIASEMGYEFSLKIHKKEVYIYVTLKGDNTEFPLGLISSFEIFA